MEAFNIFTLFSSVVVTVVTAKKFFEPGIPRPDLRVISKGSFTDDLYLKNLSPQPVRILSVGVATKAELKADPCNAAELREVVIHEESVLNPGAEKKAITVKEVPSEQAPHLVLLVAYGEHLYVLTCPIEIKDRDSSEDVTSPGAPFRVTLPGSSTRECHAQLCNSWMKFRTSWMKRWTTIRTKLSS